MTKSFGNELIFKKPCIYVTKSFSFLTFYIHKVTNGIRKKSNTSEIEKICFYLNKIFCSSSDSRNGFPERKTNELLDEFAFIVLCIAKENAQGEYTIIK